MSKTETESLKVVLIGEAGTGKTSIIQRFAYKLFDPNCASSISSQFISQIINLKEINKTLNFEIWDTAGQERYRSMAKIFYKDAKIILFVYDITSRNTFEALKNYWISQIKQECDPKSLLGLVANKYDLYNSQQVSKEEGMELANEIGAIFQFTSAKSGEGINSMFKNLGRKYLDPKYDYQEADKIAQENYRKKKEEEEKRKKERNKRRGAKLDIQNNNKAKKGGCCG
jgi:small GTP-binding protein